MAVFCFLEFQEQEGGYIVYLSVTDIGFFLFF